jgi:beta-lactamase class A
MKSSHPLKKLKVLTNAINREKWVLLIVVVAVIGLISEPSLGEVTVLLKGKAPFESGNGSKTVEEIRNSSSNEPGVTVVVRWANGGQPRQETQLVAPNTPQRNGSTGRGAGSRLERQIRSLFANLPERKAFKIWAPATDCAPAFQVELNGEERLFSASANKAFILCQRLRQLDSPAVDEQLETHQLSLDQNVWSLGSPVFNPPDLTGLVSEKTAMEAMITHSDNTATDMVLKEAGAGSVRQFIGSIGLINTLIPDSTRALAGYLLGATDYLNITYEELLKLPAIFVHPVLNNVETFASSPDDVVSFYQPALEGKFFRNSQTREEFRRILSLGDINYLVGFPLGSSVFGKAGYFDISGEHARCIAGGMYSHDRWIYFAAMINWNAAGPSDQPTVDAFYQALRTALTLVP